MASTYKRVRLGKAQRMAGDLKSFQRMGNLMMIASPGAAAVTPLGIGGVLTLGAGYVLSRGAALAIKDQNRVVMRTQAISRLVGAARTSKATAAAVSRSRSVLARTAAARSSAASRGMIPRPAARRPAAGKPGGDGQTKGYYRNQGGKRVFVQGYSTPSR